ncbi:MAG: F0F1 ATP synthase subunit epsilon [Vicinamibacterales bacterium]|nr:F0F1 ATP synthase subunit epsilon [Vicinamibacterales bacterium]
MADIHTLPTHLTLEIVTPDKALVRETVDEVQVPAAEGYLGILPGHTPLLATLQVGQLTYRSGQQTTVLHVAFGFVEVLPDRVTVLAQVAERPEDIDVERAEAAKRRAEERMTHPTSALDFDRARVAMMKSLIRLQVAQRVRMRG